MMPFVPDEQQENQQNSFLGNVAATSTQKPNWLTGNRTSFLGKLGEGALNLASTTSYAAGGILKNARDTLPNIGTTNPIKEAYSKGKTGKPLDTINTLGVTEGLRNKTAFSQELPKTLGINPKSAAGTTIGLAGEFVLPDPADIAIASKMVSKLYTKTGKTIESGGKWLAQAGIKPSPSQVSKFEAIAKKPIGEFVVDEGLAGADVAKNLGRKIDVVQNSFDDIAIRSGKQVDMGTVYKYFKREYDDLSNSIFKGVRKKGEDVKEVFNDLFLKYFPDIKESVQSGRFLKEPGSSGLKLDIGILTKERKATDALIKEGGFAIPLEQAVYYRTVRNALQDAIQEAAADLGDLKGIGLKLRSLYKLDDIVAAQKYVTSAGRLFGLGDLIAMGVGTVVGGAMRLPTVGAILAPVVRRMATSPEVLGGTSKVLTKTGQGLMNPGLIRNLARESTRFGKEAILQSGRKTNEATTDGATAGFVPDQNVSP